MLIATGTGCGIEVGTTHTDLEALAGRIGCDQVIGHLLEDRSSSSSFGLGQASIDTGFHRRR